MKTTCVFSFLAAVACVGLVAGCGDSGKATTTLPDGSKVTTNDSGSEAGFSVKNEDGETAVGSSAKVTEEKLGLPFYPGAKMDPNKSMAVKTATEESYVVGFSSTDPIDKIAAFYQDQVKGLEFSKSENAGAVIMLSKELKDARGGKLNISLVKSSPTTPVEISLGWGKTQ